MKSKVIITKAVLVNSMITSKISEALTKGTHDILA